MVATTIPRDAADQQARRHLAPPPTRNVAAGNAQSAHTDHRCEARVQAVLSASSYSAVRRVRCRCSGGTLTLYGQLPSFHYLQVALNLAQANVDEGVRIRNELEVTVRTSKMKRE